MATMWRPCSDTGQFQYRDVILKVEQEYFSVLIHAREPKESQVKTITLGQFQDPDLCPVNTLFKFITKTATLREGLPDDHTLFLTYLNSDNNISTSVRPTTVANWIKQEMELAGIDTKHFQAHSIRAASSTKAVELGYSIQEVKKHANWSLNTRTFDDFYYKPSTQHSSSVTINNSIFSSTEISITLSSEVESTGIGLGTTSNTIVDETKRNNVIPARPWFRRFF